LESTRALEHRCVGRRAGTQRELRHPDDEVHQPITCEAREHHVRDFHLDVGGVDNALMHHADGALTPSVVALEQHHLRAALQLRARALSTRAALRGIARFAPCRRCRRRRRVRRRRRLSLLRLAGCHFCVREAARRSKQQRRKRHGVLCVVPTRTRSRGRYCGLQRSLAAAPAASASSDWQRSSPSPLLFAAEPSNGGNAHRVVGKFGRLAPPRKRKKANARLKRTPGCGRWAPRC
jgi:hypothetical protein